MKFLFSLDKCYDTTQAGGYHIRVVHDRSSRSWYVNFNLGPGQTEGDVVEMGRVDTKKWMADPHYSPQNVLTEAERVASQVQSSSNHDKWLYIFSSLVKIYYPQGAIDFARFTDFDGTERPVNGNVRREFEKMILRYFKTDS